MLDVSVTPLKADLTAPTHFMSNKVAFSFRPWAKVDGRSITIDIIEFVTFNADGEIDERLAFYAPHNVTGLD